MSLTGPNVFVVAGDTDWWSPDLRSVEVSTDSRMRGLLRNQAAGSWRSTIGAGTRAPSQTKRIAEYVLVNPLAMVGLVGVGFEAATLSTHVGAVGGIGFYTGDTTVYENGVGSAIHTNLAQPVAGDVVSVMLYREPTTPFTPKLRFLLNGRRNILGFSEDFGDAAWQKVNGGTASGQRLVFVNTNSYFQQNVARVGAVGSQLTFSAWMTSSNSTTVRVILTDSVDGAPSQFQDVALVAGVRTRVTVSQTMGAGYSGALALLIAGNGVITAGTAITVEQCQVNAGLTADAYQVQTGASGGFMGHPETVTDSSYRLCVSTFHDQAQVFLNVDADDLQYPQSDCQPWGAAARVGDAGGYSPQASLFDRAPVSFPAVIDAFKRTATAGINNANHTYFSATTDRSASPGLVYCEFHYEAVDLNDMQVGLASPDKTSTNYLGSDALSWGYNQGGGTRNNGVLTMGAVAYNTIGTRPGFIWKPSTGQLWFTRNGVVHAGDPQAGTGAHYSNATGKLQPAVTVWQTVGRIRLCSHAREQLYRPSYCEAWDGGDQLPEQHYRGQLANYAELTQGIWFPVPWGGSRRTGSPIGAIEAMNADGRYDALLEWDLRDQVLAIYELSGTLSQAAARGLVEAMQFQDEKMLRMLARGMDARLDRRIDQPLFAFGHLSVSPVAAVQDQQITYNIADSAYAVGGSTANDGTGAIISNGGKLEVRDKGLLVSSFRRGNADVVRGFVRTAAVAGKQAIRNMNIRKLSKAVSDYYFLEGFSTWAGDNPSGWATVENGTTSRVTQSGNAARFIRNAGAPTLSISKALGSVTASAQVLVDMRVTAYTSGDLTISLIRDSDSAVLATAPMNITSTGRFVGFLIKADAVNNNSLLISAADSTDLTVDSVEFGRALSTDANAAVPGISPIEYVLVDCGGMAASDFNFTLGSQDITVGLWSDQRPTLRWVLDQLMLAWQRDYYTDAEGRLQFVFWEDKVEDVATLAADFTERDLIGEVTVEDDLAPALSDSHASRKNYAVHSETDLAGSVSNAERAILIAANRTVKLDLTLSGGGTGGGVSDAYAYHSFYTHAIGAMPIETLRTPAAESSDPRHPTGVGTYLYRMHRRYAKRRYFYTFTLTAAAAQRLKPGDIIRLTVPRVGLAAGKKLMVVSKTRRLVSPTVKLKAWG